ncbi:hypothetical protein AB1285_21385 [Microbacterium sp. NRRL B-14842]
MALSQRYRLLAPIALVGVASLALAGCAEGGGDEGGETKDTVRISAASRASRPTT